MISSAPRTSSAPKGFAAPSRVSPPHARPLSQRHRPLHGAPQRRLRRLRAVRQALPPGCPLQAGGIRLGAAPARLPLHRPGLRQDRPLLHRALPAAGALRAAQPHRRRDGRPALDLRPHPLHLAPGRDRPRPTPGSSTGTATPAAASTACDFGFPEQPPRARSSRARSTPGSPQPAQRRPAADPHRPPRLRRRHVVRLGQPPHGCSPAPGPRRPGTRFTCTGEGGYPGPPAALRRPRHHPGGDRPFRRAGRDHPARAHRRVQVRPGRQAGPGRPPARRQDHAGGGQDARGGRGQRPVLALPVPQRLFGRGPQEARGLDQGDQPAGPGLGQGLDPDRRGHGGRRQLLRRRAHHPPRRQLRRHRRGAGHRQEEHRHAHRVRHPQGAPLPGGGGHPRRGHPDRQRRHSHRPRRRQGHRPGRGRRGHRHGRAGGAGVHPLRHLRKRARLPARHRHHRPGAVQRWTSSGPPSAWST